MPPNLPTILAYALSFTATFKYPLILVGALIEGHIITILSGFLVRLGALSWVPSTVAVVCGNLLGDIGLYYLGRNLGARAIVKVGKFFKFESRDIEVVKKLFHRYDSKVLLASKLTNGFGFAMLVLLTAGISGISFKRFILFNSIGEVLWTSILMTVGYFFGQLYLSTGTWVWRGIALAGITIVIIAGVKMSKRLRLKIEEHYEDLNSNTGI